MFRCTKCLEEKPAEAFNRDRSRADGRYPSCKACSRAACRSTYEKNRVEHQQTKRRWKDQNADRLREIGTAYRQANPERVAAYTSAYKARLKQATPPWQDPGFLDFAKSMCPEGFEVDHIHPLRGVNFSGLNVPWNIQILETSVHKRKGRKLLPEPDGRLLFATH